MSQKIYISIIILTTFASFALTASANVGYIDTSEIPTVYIGADNIAKVCKDVTCDNPGIINFEISGDSPLIIDTENGLSGKVWGGELGWITFNPPYEGVFFADPATGLLKGTAWSENSGAINFSVTGQKVVIDPKTGKWNGWAWASGPYGGWIKFDCKNTTSCVRTTWRYKITTEAIPPPMSPSTPSSTTEAIPITEAIPPSTPSSSSDIQPVQKLSFFKNIFNQIVDFKYQMFDNFNTAIDIAGQKINNGFNFVAQITSNIYNSYAIFLTDIFTKNSLINKNFPIPSEEVSPTPNIGEKIKTVVQEKSKIMNDNFDIFVTGSTSLFNEMTALTSNIFNKVSNDYYAFSSNLINLKGSVLEAVDNLIK